MLRGNTPIAVLFLSRVLKIVKHILFETLIKNQNLKLVAVNTARCVNAYSFHSTIIHLDNVITTYYIQYTQLLFWAD